jgi:hypothetical protein
LEEGGNYYRISKAGKCIVEPSYLQMPPPPWSLEVKHDDATDLSIIIDSREPSHILILYDHSNNYSLPAGLPNEIAAAKLDEADRYADILNNSMRPPEMPAYHIWK